MSRDIDRHHPQDEPVDLLRLAQFLAEGADALSGGFVRNNVATDRYDARLFRELVESSEELRGLAGANDAPKTFGPLVLDLFTYFYKFVPSLVDPGEVDPAHLQANRPFVERMAEDERSAITRLTTATDEVASSLATIEAARRILDELRRRPELSGWMERASQHPHEDASSPPEVTPGAPPEAPSEASQTTPPANPDQQPATAAEDPSDDPPPATHLREAARSAMNAASSEASEHAATLRGWGMKPKDLRVVNSLAGRIELARKIRTKRLKDLADLLGSMRNHRRAIKKRKLKANRDELYSIELGGDISRALPSERAAAFGSGDQRSYRTLDFFRRLSERAVLSHSLRTEEPVGRGDVIAMVDASGSMAGAPMQWASAISLALAQAASATKKAYSARRVHLIFFNAKVILEVTLQPGENDVRKFLQIASVEAAGGTEYVPPVLRALELLDDFSQPTADLLLVTDGLCRLPEDYTERLAVEKARSGFKLVSVLVGEHASPGSLEPFSERVITARDLAAASGARNAAGEVFESL